MQVIFEFDDLNPHQEVDCLDTIKRLVFLYPRIKLTFFVPAAYKNFLLTSDYKWCDEIRGLVENGNVSLTIHGLFHSQEEFKVLDKNEAENRLKEAESIFQTANLPFDKIFRGPHWGNGEGTYQALISRNYKSCWTHEDYRWLAEKYPDMKSVYYNWNLKDKFEDSGLKNDGSIVIAHGHSHATCGNGIEESLDRICSFIDKYNPEFLFARDYE